MNIRLGLNSGVARHGIFSSLVGPRIALAPEDGSGGAGGEGGGATGASGGADAAATPAAEPAKPEGTPSALAGAAKEAPAKSEGEPAKPEGAGDRVEGADKVKPGDEIGGEAKPEKTPEELAAEAAAPKDVDGNPLPEKYEVKMPDGVEMDAGLMELASPVFKEHKMSPAQAQAVTDLYVKTQEQAIEKHVEQTNNWLKDSKADKEIGGKEYDKNLGHAGRAFQAFGNERAMQIFDTYGLGNNPDILRIFVRMGKALGEGSTVLPGAEHGDVSTAEVMYPSMKKK